MIGFKSFPSELPSIPYTAIYKFKRSEHIMIIGNCNYKYFHFQALFSTTAFMLTYACNIEYCVCSKCEKGDRYCILIENSMKIHYLLFLIHLTDLEECRAGYLNLKV